MYEELHTGTSLDATPNHRRVYKVLGNSNSAPAFQIGSLSLFTHCFIDKWFPMTLTLWMIVAVLPKKMIA